MAHPFFVKDIAFQAGLSTAAVDRVLNGRPGVRQQTEMRDEQRAHAGDRYRHGDAAAFQ